MLKRLATIATLTVGFSGLAATPASAGNCGLASLLSTCDSSQPAPAPSQSPPNQSSQPSSSQAAPAPESRPAGSIGDEPAAAARILQLVNHERATRGLPGLESRPAIAEIALRQSHAMAGQRNIWHNDGYFTASTRQHLRARGLGENVALNGSIDDAHRRLMASPGHRSNILDGNFDAVGMAVVHDANGVLYVTQNFVDSEQGATAAPAKKKSSKASARKGRKSSVRRSTARKPSRSSASRSRR